MAKKDQSSEMWRTVLRDAGTVAPSMLTLPAAASAELNNVKSRGSAPGIDTLGLDATGVIVASSFKGFRLPAALGGFRSTVLVSERNDSLPAHNQQADCCRIEAELRAFGMRKPDDKRRTVVSSVPGTGASFARNIHV